MNWKEMDVDGMNSFVCFLGIEDLGLEDSLLRWQVVISKLTLDLFSEFGDSF